MEYKKIVQVTIKKLQHLSRRIKTSDDVGVGIYSAEQDISQPSKPQGVLAFFFQLVDFEVGKVAKMLSKLINDMQDRQADVIW